MVTLEQNYRSTQPILDATNEVIAAPRRAARQGPVVATRTGGAKPQLVSCDDEDEQTEFIIRSVLDHREAGLALRRQAVLFRASHHSLALELELARRNIPFHKYGGLRFVETAHVKDLMAFLRLAENPRDLMAGTRVLHAAARGRAQEGPGAHGPAGDRRVPAIADSRHCRRTRAAPGGDGLRRLARASAGGRPTASPPGRPARRPSPRRRATGTSWCRS